MAEPAKKRGQGTCAPLSRRWEKQLNQVPPAKLLRPHQRVPLHGRLGCAIFILLMTLLPRRGKATFSKIQSHQAPLSWLALDHPENRLQENKGTTRVLPTQDRQGDPRTRHSARWSRSERDSRAPPWTDTWGCGGTTGRRCLRIPTGRNQPPSLFLFSKQLRFQ